MNVWLVVLAAGVGSYLFRISMIVLVERIGMSAPFERASALVVPAAFAALAAGGIAANSMADELAHAVPSIVAVAVAVAIVRHTGSSYMAIVAGMPALWVLNALLPSG